MSADSPWGSGPVAISGQPPGEVAEDDALAVSDADRYREGGLLGRGGMGEVHAVRDLRLGRDVARKVVAEGGAFAEARLAREAQITARLEHPGIVPVYNAGRDENGRAWYTMRVVRGQTLGDALAELPNPVDRAPLLRHFLDACEAVAFAHSLGVVHRDLKPANLLIGAFGETQVADWGLARVLTEPDLRGDAGTPGGPVTQDGAVIGTPGYMSPEQAAGSPATERSDVWSLGAILFEILTGQTLWTGDPNGILNRLCHEQAPSVLDLRPDAPPELAAVVARALLRDPALRYASAESLVNDLKQWFDGRPVSAYEYSSWDLLRRFLRAWRVPLAVGFAALLTGGSVALVMYGETVRERDRAREAEAETLAALHEADQNMALLMVNRAREALRDGDRSTAELLAVAAAERAPSPESRGILAAFGHAQRPELLRRQPLGPCETLTVDRTASFIACIQADRTLVLQGEKTLTLPGRTSGIGWSGTTMIRTGSEIGVLWLDGGGERWQQQNARTGDQVVPVPNSDVAAVLGGGAYFVVAPDHQPLRVDTCGRRVVTHAAASPSGEMLTTCDDGAVWLGTVEAPNTRLLWSDPALLASAIELQNSLAAVATIRGEVVVLDRDGQVRHTVQWGGLPLIDVAMDSAGERVLLTNERGRVALLDLVTGALLATFPTRARRARWRSNDQVRLVGEEVVDWSVPAQTRPVKLLGPEGVAAVAISPDGAQISSAHGDGTLLMWSVRDGRPVAELRWQTGVVKDVVYAPDGKSLLACGTHLKATQWIDARDGRTLGALPGRTLRRLVWPSTGAWGLTYGEPALNHWSTVEEGALPVDVSLVPLTDLDATADGRFVGLGRDGTVLQRGVDGTHSVLLNEPFASAVAASARRVVVAYSGGIVALSWSGAELFRVPGPAEPLDIAVSPDGRVAVGARDGTVWTWTADGALDTRLQAHDGGVSAVAFGPGDLLVSGSWDHAVRLWNLGAYAGDGMAVPAMERAWGVDVATLIGEG